MRLTFVLCALAGVVLAMTRPAMADQFHIPIAANCGSNGSPAIPQLAEPKFSANYVVSLRYLDRNKHPLPSPLPFLGSGFVARGESITRSDFAVQTGGTLRAAPVCTGYAASVFVDPISETEARVRVAVEHAYLGGEIIKQRLEAPPLPAAPVPQRTVIEKTVQMKSGESQSFEVVGDPEFGTLQISFTTLKP